MALFQKITYGANNNQDMVIISLGDFRWQVAYQTAFDICHNSRMQCKRAARIDRAPATLVQDFVPDLKDCPRPHRGFRRSNLVSNVDCYKMGISGVLVSYGFNGVVTELGYEDGLKLSVLIRQAARRAKAWAGDTSTQSGVYGMLTSAEDDYRLGLM